ncbi:Aflatoxin biosynthesis ketoreductase nor-1 [Fusarium austroafricanum]|uniref:Aflatoxin biosynthesis ketoreductase nor-1 n=1 Tax=Fusarium austroafricanum TaxID=2364996 RepID=A0A8H4NXB8_9HYPO|nr:Aflatoxin biosynthesis ketoreductase nor-1 [Fusarium austroafricanum]
MTAQGSNTVYVVTGANRGIGLGLVKALLARDSTTVIATVRNDKSSASLQGELSQVSAGKDSTFEIVQLDFSAAISPEQIRDTIASKVDHVDILICNAAFSPPMTLTTQTSAANLRTAFEVNTIGPLTVFQCLWPLLQKSAAPKVINVTSSVGCITHQEAPGGAYGPSKAALNWITKSLHLQNESLVAVALHPGWVGTDMGEFSAKEWGCPGITLETVDGSVQGMLNIIDGATRDTTSGKFVTYKGQILPW